MWPLWKLRRKGLNLSLRLSKKEGIPIQVVPENTPGASVVAVKRVNELDHYSLGAQQLADKLGLTRPKTLAIVDYFGFRNDADCYKEFKIGNQSHKRYSPKAIDRIKQALETVTADEIWQTRGGKRKRRLP